MYKKIIRPILFLFNPENAHNLILGLLGFIGKFRILRRLNRIIYKYDNPSLEREVFGIKFPNPVGLSAGLDKNAKYYNPLSDFGFGFIEVGSLTPEPQLGNPKPRIFRIPKDRAIINRMGINNDGVLEAIKSIKENKPEVIIAANIAKNSGSHDEDIPKDYDRAFSLLYDFVDFFVINLSCPNVIGLTNLQDISYLSDILGNILDRRMSMDQIKPILLKISLDIPKEQLDDIIDYSLRVGIDGLVVGNTTKTRTGLTISQDKIEQIGEGGMSGATIFPKSIELIKYITQRSNAKLPIIGVGGIMSPKDAKAMLDAGASLVEVYTGFIYEGPSIVKRILKSLSVKNDN